MQVFECSCSPAPVVDLSAPNAQAVDIEDEEGRWHALRIGAEFRRLTLLSPSPERAAREEARREAMRPQHEEGRRSAALTERLRPRVLAALVVRLSSGFDALSAQRRARVQAILDDAAGGILADLEG